MSNDRDVIGDIHGQHLKLIALLRRLGYRERFGVWRHPTRKALFVGDYIDRGPGQEATLWIVRSMIEAGAAEGLMGNHEFNGIAFHTPDDLAPGAHLRPRSAKNRLQHGAFLEAVGEDSTLHKEWVDWFRTLPLWIEHEGLRAVHACWHPASMAALAPDLGPNNTLPPALIEAASRKGSVAYEAVEALCKGLEIELPPGMGFTDKDGTVRRRTRVRWWDPSATTYRTGALVAPAAAAQLPDTPLPASARVLYDDKKPVFFGHYWFTGSPRVIGSKICCVDYSAARDKEPLIAYRWSGESDLTDAHLISSDPSWSPPIALGSLGRAHRPR